MSYANGVGALQQVLSAIPPATTQTTPTTQTTQATESGSASNQRNAAVANAGHAGHADQANLSSAGGMISHALEGSDVRPEKVAALQQAIASGSYKVSSSEVAGKMIQSLLE